MQADIFDVTAQDFQSVIAQGSVNKPVLVIFWSSQCNVCQQLLPLLEELQREHNSAFTLARVNCDSEYQLAQHLNIQNVPTVYMFVNGQAADGFVGEQSKQVIDEFIKKHLPDPTVALLQEAQTFFAQGELNQAKEAALAAQKIDNKDSQVKLTLAQIYLAQGEFENAKPLLESIPMVDQNMIYHSLMSELKLAEESSQTPEITALEAELETAQDKLPIQYKLAIQYHQAKRYSEALQLLYSLLLVDIGFDEGNAKKTMLDILATIDDAQLVSQYRRKLYSLLY